MRAGLFILRDFLFIYYYLTDGIIQALFGAEKIQL